MRSISVLFTGIETKTITRLRCWTCLVCMGWKNLFGKNKHKGPGIYLIEIRYNNDKRVTIFVTIIQYSNLPSFIIQ